MPLSLAQHSSSRSNYSPGNKSLFTHRLLAASMAICLFVSATVCCQSNLKALPVDKPNIVVINLDDADFDMLSPDNLAMFFPNMQRFSTDGLRLTNFHVTTPLCGPSRASLFRGQYAHNTGVRSNDSLSFRSNGFTGGMRLYQEKGYFNDDISMWMKNAGYRTMMVGKFLHSDVIDVVPPGWDDFYSSRGANYYLTTRFTNETNPEGLWFQESESTYRTFEEANEITSLIDQHVARDDDKPFFMYIAPLAPHQQTPHSPYGMIETQYESWWQGMRMPQNESVQEVDFSDKSTAIRNLPLMVPNQAAKIDSRHRERMLSVKSVDDMFGRITQKLEQHELTGNTYIFLTSDNGFCNGHHRLIGKGDAFNKSTHVPMYVLGPNVPAGASANHLLAHIDLAPTIAELGGATTSPDVDGKSFVRVINDPSGVDDRTWQNAIMIENFESRFLTDKVYNTSTVALRFYDSVYVEWANGTSEYYDLSSDPHQIQNTYNQLPIADRNFMASYLKTFRRTPTEPDTTVYQPFGMNALASRRIPIMGMAEDDSGITRVRLAIKRFSDSYFWNGEDWQPGRVLVEANVTQPGQNLTTWSYDSIPQGQPVDDLIGIWARAYDDAGKFDRSVAFSVFRVDYTRPQSVINEPQKNDTVETIALKGTASDEGGVDFVRLVVRDRANGRYYNGSAWVDYWTWVPVPVSRTGRWRYDNDQISGSFYFSTRAVDFSGNVQSPPTQTWFNVEKQ